MTDKINIADKDSHRFSALAKQIKAWGIELGFQQVGITNTKLEEHINHYQRWLDNEYHGEMLYMKERQHLRNHPEQLQPHALRVISVRMDYLPANTETVRLLDHPEKAYISRYALGRDYHKLIRKRLSLLASKIENALSDSAELTQNLSHRPFVDSAPILERALAEKAGLGWIGKNTMLINKKAGAWFFIGELLSNLPLPLDNTILSKHCGSCSACLDICPTQAFNSPYELDARKCISYLTIELKGTIPKEFRKPMGNRVFGCDDCNLICPWNKFAKHSSEDDFSPRHSLDDTNLLDLFLWDEDTFNKKTEGSAIRRIGYERWLRNLAIGLGNGKKSDAVITALQTRKNYSELVAEHIEWALEQLT